MLIFSAYLFTISKFNIPLHYWINVHHCFTWCRLVNPLSTLNTATVKILIIHLLNCSRILHHHHFYPFFLFCCFVSYVELKKVFFLFYGHCEQYFRWESNQYEEDNKNLCSVHRTHFSFHPNRKKSIRKIIHLYMNEVVTHIEEEEENFDYNVETRIIMYSPLQIYPLAAFISSMCYSFLSCFSLLKEFSPQT